MFLHFLMCSLLLKELFKIVIVLTTKSLSCIFFSYIFRNHRVVRDLTMVLPFTPAMHAIRAFLPSFLWNDTERHTTLMRRFLVRSVTRPSATKVLDVVTRRRVLEQSMYATSVTNVCLPRTVSGGICSGTTKRH